MGKPRKIPELNFKGREPRAFEFSILPSDQLLNDRRPSDPNPYRPHRIRYYAVLFVMRGKGLHFIDFKKYPYQKGSLIFISREQVHAFQKNPDLEAYFLWFTEKFLEGTLLGSNLRQQLSLYNYQLYAPVVQIKPEHYRTFSELIINIQEEYHLSDDFATEEILQSALKMLLLQAERERNRQLENTPQAPYYPEFIAFQELIKENLLQNRQVQFYADQLNMSTKKLNRITQKIVQQPAKTYLNEMLILEIKRYLMNTTLSNKEIAYRTGFEAPTNFVKFFKKYTDLTPAAFRRQY